MPRGLKETSSQIAISGRLLADTDTANSVFVEDRVDLQLNPLDNEVFVVTGVKIDFTEACVPATTTPGTYRLSQTASITKTQVGASTEINNPNCIASSKISAVATSGAVEYYTVHENNASDAPPVNAEYLDIIATNDFHVGLLLSANYINGATVGIAYRIYGYRAKADSAIYASLVQSEMLSS